MKTSEWAELIGNNVRQRRRRQIITRQDLADRCGVDRSYITKIEAGSRTPSINILVALAEHLYMKDWRDLLYDGERIESGSL